MLAIKMEELEFSAVKHPQLQAPNLSIGWWGLGRKPGLTEDRRAATGGGTEAGKVGGLEKQP